MKSFRLVSETVKVGTEHREADASERYENSTVSLYSCLVKKDVDELARLSVGEGYGLLVLLFIIYNQPIRGFRTS